MQTLSGSGGLGLLADARVFQITVAASPSLAEATVVTLDERAVTIGREPPASCRRLALKDDQASRRHAEVTYNEAGDFYEIRDLESRNGIFVDGQRAPSARLAHGTVVRIGRSLLVCTDRRLGGDDPLAPEWPTLCGIGLAMQRVRGDIERVAPHAIPVLILGETGTGKELVARDLHRLSGRAGPLVAVNCAAIPEGIAESELFGHAAGAFTGAVQRTDGFFASAQGGTLFLDEVAELPASVQAKLLRAIGTGEVRPLGRSEARKVDVRVVAATHRDVSPDGGFRADLLARLAGWTLRLPPLRDRREDILGLAAAFAARESRPPSLATSAAEALLLHDWPRNVRELEMVIAAASVRAGPDRVIQCAHLPESIGAAVAARTQARRSDAPLDLVVPRDRTPSLADLQIVLTRFDGSIARVADYFGKDRKQVYRWLERAGIASHRS
jgi:DNA-binding NtrC family response regulator